MKWFNLSCQFFKSKKIPSKDLKNHIHWLFDGILGYLLKAKFDWLFHTFIYLFLFNTSFIYTLGSFALEEWSYNGRKVVPGGLHDWDNNGIKVVYTENFSSIGLKLKAWWRFLWEYITPRADSLSPGTPACFVRNSIIPHPCV